MKGYPSCSLLWQAIVSASTCQTYQLICQKEQLAQARSAALLRQAIQIRWNGAAKPIRSFMVCYILAALPSNSFIRQQQALIEQIYSLRLTSLLLMTLCSTSCGLTTFLTTQSNLLMRMMRQSKLQTLLTNYLMSCLILPRMERTDGSTITSSSALMDILKETYSLKLLPRSNFSFSWTQVALLGSRVDIGRRRVSTQCIFFSSNLRVRWSMWSMRKKAIVCNWQNSSIMPSLYTIYNSFSIRIFFSKFMLRVKRFPNTLFMSQNDSDMGNWNFYSNLTDICRSLPYTACLLAQICLATRPTQPEFTCPPRSAIYSNSFSSTFHDNTRQSSRNSARLILNLFSTNRIMREPRCHRAMNLMAGQYLKKWFLRSRLKSSYSWMRLSRGVSSPQRTIPLRLTVIQSLPFSCYEQTQNSQMPVTFMQRNSQLCDFCSMATILGMVSISFLRRQVMVSLMGSRLSTLMVGRTLIDFMRWRISRMFIIYYTFYYTRRTVERFSREGKRRCVIDLFRPVYSLPPSLLALSRRCLAYRVPSLLSVSSLPMSPIFLAEGCSLRGSNLTLRRFLRRSLFRSIFSYIYVPSFKTPHPIPIHT